MDYPIIGGGLNWQALENLIGGFGRQILSHGLRVADQTDAAMSDPTVVNAVQPLVPHGTPAVVIVAVFGLGLLIGVVLGQYYREWDSKAVS